MSCDFSCPEGQNQTAGDSPKSLKASWLSSCAAVGRSSTQTVKPAQIISCMEALMLWGMSSLGGDCSTICNLKGSCYATIQFYLITFLKP